MVAKELARKADSALASTRYRVHHDFPHETEAFDRVTGTVVYVGCGRDLSSLFLFENAQRLVHQDLTDRYLPIAMRRLERKKIITDFQKLSDGPVRGESAFSFRGRRRRLIEVHGDSSDPRQVSIPFENETVHNKGNIGFVVPDEAKENLEAIDFFGMPYDLSIRAIQINLLPHLSLGGIFYGPYPYRGGCFEGASPEKLGLEKRGEVYVKVRHITSAEVEETIGFTIADYARILETRDPARERWVDDEE